MVTGFFNPDGLNPASPDLAQGYITHFATRYVYYIDAKKIGLIALLYVGMADVSSCEIAPEFKDRGENGVPETKLNFIPEATPRDGQKNIPIRSALARVYNDDLEPGSHD
ncbi:hypothetical protein V8C26DRAFT_432718 [Trichoderma gracile]